MRPLRLLLLLLFAFTTLLLLSLLPRHHAAAGSPSKSPANSGSPSNSRSRFSPFFSFHSPLFPSSAIISLTDDNSTFFLSRPAAFGPNLPSHGLSGQLWVGRGFGMDDPLGRLGMMSDVELGCSDVPGWDEARAIKLRNPSSSSSKGSSSYIDELDKKNRRSTSSSSTDEKTSKMGSSAKPDDDDDSMEELNKAKNKKNGDEDVNDGTDDYLNRPFMNGRARVDDDSSTISNVNENADIQTLQESAEIQGKIVLLSRGGCGFLEKVKWAQRRGGVALIVGDNIPGGALVTMYAKGDTLNITIPSIFTSYTTAHLLSSLIPSGSSDHHGLLGVSSDSLTSGSKNENTKNQKQVSEKESSISKKSEDASQQPSLWRKIISCLGFSCSGNSKTVKTSSSSVRPPSSGRHDWVMVEDFDEPKEESSKSSSSSKKDTPQTPVDNFIIGVQDWRNPDVVRKPTTLPKASQSNPTDKSKNIVSNKPGQSKGESSTSKNEVKEKVPRSKVTTESTQKSQGSKSDDLKKKGASDKRPDQKSTSNHASFGLENNAVHPHEGLWVTLTPTAMSSSPFIDTLLVLVVSPLVTLTVVYAMLLIRSRIRRRRWRAPKSVVERLPVRTYHTISSNSGTGSSTSLSASVTAPLLTPSAPGLGSRAHSRQRPRLGKSRPRSRTTGEVLDQSSSAIMVGPSDVEGDTSPTLLTPGTVTPSGIPSPNLPSLGSSDDDPDGETLSLTESEKREKGLAEWRRRYGGRQRECVVCLEEYVDGVSRVMSLPCGHEFHAECITPWLTTRRRTCPICKGDVVRSLARQDMVHSHSRSPFQRYRDNPSSSRLRVDDDEQDFEDDDNVGPVEDGPLPPFVGNERQVAYPFSSSAGTFWRGWSSWGLRTYASTRDWAVDQYTATFGTSRGRRRRRRGDPDETRDRLE